MIKKINKKNKSLEEYVHDFIVEIRKPTYMNPFKTPVDPDLVPHYYAVIKNPMDLSTLTQKFKEGKYTLLSEVKNDFQLMIDNCETFNPVGTWIRPLCDKFKANFEKSWGKLIETLERKGVDPNKKMEKMPDFEENKSITESQQNLLLAENLGLRTRNQISIIKDSLNESMENSNHNVNSNMSTFVNNSAVLNETNVSFLGESFKDSLVISEKPKPIIPPKPLITPEKNSEKSLNVQEKIIQKPIITPEKNNPKPPIAQERPLLPWETLKFEENTIKEEELAMENEERIKKKEQKPLKIEEKQPVNVPKESEPNEKLPSIRIKLDPIPNPQMEIEPPKKPEREEKLSHISLKIKEEKVEVNEKAIVEEEEFLPDLHISLDIHSITTKFREYAEHKLRKYKKNILKSIGKLHYIFTNIHDQDQSLDFLNEMEVIKSSKSIDYNMICVSLMKIMIWLRKNSSKINEAKTTKRILAYFSFILKALRRVNAISKKSKAMGMIVAEETFIAQDMGLIYFRENLNRIQAIYSTPTKISEPPQLTSSNSIKITLPLPKFKVPKEKQEIEDPIPKVIKKPLPEKTPTFSSPSTKIVLNKDMSKVKNISIEKPAENKADRLYSWAAVINSKINDKIEGYFNARLNQHTINQNSKNKQEPLKLEKKETSLEIQLKSNRRFSEETSMFEERKTPIEINFARNNKTFQKTNVFMEDEFENFAEDLPTEIIAYGNDIPVNQPNKIQKFNEILIRKTFKFKNPFWTLKMEDEYVAKSLAASTKITIDEMNIYSLFKEIDEKERNILEETTKHLKKSNNEKLKYTKYERIVDKSSKSFLEISQEVSLDKIMSISMKIRSENFTLEIANKLETSSFDLFVDLKRIQKINELNLVENAHWLNYDVLSSKLMKHKLFDALLNQLIKASKFQVEREGGIYYCIDRIPNENNGCTLSIWTAVERLNNLKLKVDDFVIF